MRTFVGRLSVVETLTFKRSAPSASNACSMANPFVWYRMALPRRSKAAAQSLSNGFSKLIKVPGMEPVRCNGGLADAPQARGKHIVPGHDDIVLPYGDVADWANAFELV